MTISTATLLEKGLNSDFSRYSMSKGAPDTNTTVIGTFTSYWKGVGAGGLVGVTPTTTTTALNHLSVSAPIIRQQGSGRASYLASLTVSATTAPTTIEIHDRLIHMGGLDGANNGLQTINGCDLSLFLATNNIDARKGDANYSDVQWWLEFYVNNTVANQSATVGVTYNDGTTGNLTAIPNIGQRPGKLVALNPYIPVAAAGKYIRGITGVTLSANTGANSSFGFTATRYRAAETILLATKLYTGGWTNTGLPEIHNQSCLFPIAINPTTAAITTIRIDAIIAHG